MNDNKTKDWQLYEAGKKYNSRLKPNYYDTVNTNQEFFAGNQWINSENTTLMKPVFNILKRVVTFFVASLTSTDKKIHLEPLTNSDDDQNLQDEMNPAEIANAEIENLLDKFKFSNRRRDALFDGAITGDACFHFWWDKDKKPYGQMYSDIEGEIDFELKDGTNVMFGNANNREVEKQPYIIVVGRDMVENLKAEAEQYPKKAEQQEITSDNNYLEQVSESGKIEVEADDYGKALYIIVYRKDTKTGHIIASKSVEKAYIYQDIDTGLTHYPIAWFNWERQKNQYHGRAMITGLIPNQIFINKMFAMVMYHLMMTAFPKVVFNKDLLPDWDNDIGVALGVEGLGADISIKNIADYIQPGNMSNQITQVIELAMQYTKECLGISDASLGNIDPKNTSAIIAVQKSAVIPLENVDANENEFIEDIGNILMDFMGNYYGLRPIVIEKDGVKQIVKFDFNVFKTLLLNCKVDVGQSAYWSEIASVQTLDNLLKENRIDIIDYLERLPDGFIPQKDQLIQKLKETMQQLPQDNQQQIPQNSDKQAMYEQMAQFVESLPQEEQDKIKQMGDGAEEYVLNLMQQGA